MLCARYRSFVDKSVNLQSCPTPTIFRRVVQTFDIVQTTELKEKKKRLRKQGDMRERPTRKALTGGVVEVCANKKATMNKIVYEDMRTETLTTKQLLERTAFLEDPRRTQRLRELERQANAAGTWPHRGPVRTAAQRKHRKARRIIVTGAAYNKCSIVL